MKNNILFIFLLIALSGHSQNLVYFENFDTGNISGSSNCGIPWTLDNTLFVSSPNSYKGDIVQDDTTCYITNSFSTLGNTNVILNFDHICKVEFLDYAVIQVSIDGITWVNLTDNEYLGTGIFGAGGNKFSAITYSIWDAAVNTSIPQNNWWQYETFDISNLVADQPFVQVKFLLYDGNSTGAVGNYGWLIENVEVQASLSELNPPLISLVPPILEGNITGTGPFTIIADIVDNSGIDTAMLIYAIDNSTIDTVPMIDSLGLYYGMLPEGYYGDVYCYQVYAIDASLANNPGIYPEIDSCISFTSIPLPPSITLGNGNLSNLTTTYPTPYGNYNFGARHQFLLHASELHDAGIIGTEILSIMFDVVQVAGVPLEDFTIKIGHSIQNDLNTWETGLSTVFYDPDYTEIAGTNEHVFQSEFYWNGIDNIVVETCFNNPASFINASVSQTQYNFTASRWYNADAIGICNSTTFSGGVSNNRPNIKLRFPVPNDIDVLNVLNPLNIGCDFSSLEYVTVLYQNMGTDPQDQLILTYLMTDDAGSSISATESVSTYLEPGDSLIYTFSDPVDLSLSGQYDFTFITGVVVQGNLINTDTVSSYIINNTYHNTPFIEDFETFLPFVPPNGVVQNGWQHDYVNGTISWNLNQGSTPSTNTGPSGDHTSGLGNYFFIEASNNLNEKAILNSPCIDISQLYQPEIHFWYHMYGSTTGTLALEILDENGDWDQIWYLQGDQGNIWHEAISDISQYLNQGVIKFRVVGEVGPDFYSDIAIDDFLISDPLDEDVGVGGILSPSINSCGLGNEVITIEVINFGTSIQDTIPVSYSLDGGFPITELFITTLFPADTAYYSFSTTADMSTLYQEYYLSAWTELVTDQSIFNDSIIDVQLINAVISGSGGEDFDVFTPGTGSLIDPGILTNGWIRNPEPLNGETGYAWMVNMAATASTNTGPNNDNTSGCGMYIYTESSSGIEGDETTITSPCIDATSHLNTQMKFYYHMYGTTVGALYIDVHDGINWINAVDSIIGQQQLSNLDPWIEKQVSLAQFSGNQIKVRFRAVRGSSYTCDLAIDDFYIYDQISYDAAVIDFIYPTLFTTTGYNSLIEIVITNFGTTPITLLDLTYNDGSGPITENWTGNLLPGNSTNYTFTTPLIAASGIFTLCANTSLINDGQISNDEICIDILGLPIDYLPHINNFESSSSIWVSDDECFQDWEQGIPSGSIINSAYSGTNVWATNLTGYYGNNINEFLYTTFFDFSNAFSAELKFKHIYDFPATGDGGRIDYSIDGGQTWQTLGSASNSTNWYNTTNIVTTNLPGWTGSSSTLGGWHESTILLDFLDQTPTPVQFRFVMASNDYTNNYDGWAIDDFEIDVPIANSAASILAHAGVNANFVLPMTNEVYAEIENTGVFDLNSFDISLEIDGVFIVTDNVTLSTPLLTGETVVHTFTEQWQSPTGIREICVWTENPNSVPDGFPWDDTLCINITVFDSTSIYPYCNNFDGVVLDPWVTLNPYTYSLNTIWEVGVPSQVALGMSYSSPHAWMTDLNGDYVDKDSSALYTPVFDVDADTCYDISFMHKYYTEEYEDGGVLEFTQDGGYSWLRVGFAFEPDWYDSEYITGLGGPPAPPGWSGTSNGWEIARHSLKFPNSGSTIFRFRFGSDMSIQNEGWVIDDFCLTKIGDCNIPYTGTPVVITEVEKETISFDYFIPNPTKNYSSINFNTYNIGNLNYTVTNLLGRVILKEKVCTVIGKNTLAFNVRTWDPGIYYIVFDFEGVYHTKKLVVIQ